MRSWKGALVSVLLGAMAAGWVPAVGEEGVPGFLPRGPLRPEGRWLRDPLGRVVILHGVNGVWKIPPYHPPESQQGFTRADARLLRELGFNVFRLGWIWKGLEPAKDRVDRAYLDALERWAKLLEEEGIFVLLDSHQDMYNERFKGEGFPDWATYDDGIPLLVDAGFPGNYLTPAVSRAFDNLWMNREGIWGEYASAWKEVASRFASHRMVLGYDLLNEPWPGTQWPTCAQPAGCPAFDRLFLQPFQDTVTAAIREVDRVHIAFYEPHVLFNFGVGSWLSAPPSGAAPVGLSFHDYCLSGDLGAITGVREAGEAGKAACPGMDSLVFQNAASTARSLGGPPLLTEFGAGDDLAEVERYVELADSSLTGWIYWQYKNWSDPTGAPGPEGLFREDSDLASLKQEKAAVLSRVYPMAVAGTPISYRFDPAGKEFRLEYSPEAAARGPTVVFVPVARHYPGGYRVEAEGARVTSPPCSTYLTLENLPGSARVAVRVFPGACRGGWAGQMAGGRAVLPATGSGPFAPVAVLGVAASVLAGFGKRRWG